MANGQAFDVAAVREHFDGIRAGRIVTNNAASTLPPRELIGLAGDLAASYENVHRGQSVASRRMTERFEAAYDTIAQWIGASGRRSISLHRNTTEAHNAVMYTLLTEFRDGDNVVTTLMEHNSNYVPWYGLAHEILPAFDRHVEVRLARFDHATGALDLEHLRSLVDERTKLISCTGASNFLGTKPDLAAVRAIADASGYDRPDGTTGSLLLVDGAQLLATTPVDVTALDMDFFTFSFHKLLAPFGVGVLYAKEELRETTLPFLYGGDMIAEGRVTPDAVEYNELPWRNSAGTPNILGAILSAQALRLAADLVGASAEPLFSDDAPIAPGVAASTARRIGAHTADLTVHAMVRLAEIPGLTLYGVPPGEPRSPLAAFNIADHDPFAIAEALSERGVEARAGCHCATLAHHDLGLKPAASCRLSFALYNSRDDVDRAVDAVAGAVGHLVVR